jgi:hypothetical protein
VLAGNAVVTVQSGKTGKHFTYKIKRHKDGGTYFVKLLVGDDNQNDYKYIGCFFDDTDYFYLIDKYRQSPEKGRPPSIRAISFLLKHLNDGHPQLHVYHAGRCGRCGRLLTTPESIERGFGPECEKFV